MQAKVIWTRGGDVLISVAIVEDNSTESENLYSLLKLYGDDVGVEIKITKFDNGFKFLDGYKAVYDVVFLDIEMPDMDGMTVARKLREFDRSIFVVFVTNIAKYAIHGYEVDALDYFLKPARCVWKQCVNKRRFSTFRY